MKSGFTLLELLIVLLIIAIVTAFAVPRVTLFAPSPSDEFTVNFNRLLRLGYVRALTTGVLHRVFFNVNNRLMQLEEETSITSSGKRVFEPVGALNMPTQYAWSPVVEIRNFFIKKHDENARGTLKDAWFYIFPAGLTQEVIINIEDNQRRAIRGVVVNPFSAQCVVHETLQKP